MILPEGITGFNEETCDIEPPSVDPKLFARACHEVARAESGRVERLEPARYPRNYHRAIIQLRDKAVAVLCNAHLPWIAFAEVNDDFPLRFIEAAPLESRFKEAIPCEVVSISSLNASPDAGTLAGLRAFERKQIQYWRPQRLGDIIFNFWD